MNVRFFQWDIPTRLTAVKVNIFRGSQTTIHVAEPSSTKHAETGLSLGSVYALRVLVRGALGDLSAAGRGNAAPEWLWPLFFDRIACCF